MPPSTPAGRDDSTPLLIYDGDCRFCVYWVDYWRQLTGAAVRYAPYQEVGHEFPEIATETFRRGVQYISPARRGSGAEASFLTLSHAKDKAFWLWLYGHVPGFAAVSEWAYARIAAHRSAAYHLTRVLWGRSLTPPRHELVTFLFLRAIALVYLAAFASFGTQALGLIGSHGILPLADLVTELGNRAGAERFFEMPMLFWLNAGDAAIEGVCWTGVALSLLLFFGLWQRTALLLSYVLYLSLLYGGQEFMSYQWDVYLLEAGLLTLLMTLSRAPGRWLLRWLLFRFMFMSGVVKLASGDASWWNLSALSYHFVTEPLPTPLAWYAAHLPTGALWFAAGATFFVELVLPFLIFAPRRLRLVAAVGFIGFQSLIVATGNYNWFNLQTIALCVLLFDDAALRRLLPKRLAGWRTAPDADAPRPLRRVVASVSVLLVLVSLVQMDERFGGRPPRAALAVQRLLEPLHPVSGYGLFAVMTTERDEIVIEGSRDGASWEEYEFRYKPGDVTRRPPWNIPHQPRLDWQMWFAALEDPRRLPWFGRFLQKILENDPAVTALLAKNPFPKAAPRFVRARFYDYRYGDALDKARGIWWRRRLLGLYFPEVRLR